MAKDAIKMAGKVIHAHNASEFDVLLENNLTIRGHVSGKMKLHHIKIIPGDKVDVEISPYDLSKGRIVYRHK
ncbi:translation initiation factor IF-1 [Mesomycoplasma lagogenitalium]|uniref:Translation initiation factor IF-1 n=1 Tax=Mesomycoplasma lagogenitalium TaxID=171286 RepID=A0ABY8LWE0_9BACT|nr:translation initiation factor IF-1 [Mesomycoplasma lagogenitalium]WGI36566.1 translation initiation factor IF-1 [Mesomycoplasma lagogenitalium]